MIHLAPIGVVVGLAHLAQENAASDKIYHSVGLLYFHVD